MKRLVVVVSAVLSGVLVVGVVGAARYRADARRMQHDPAVQKLLERHARSEAGASTRRRLSER